MAMRFHLVLIVLAFHLCMASTAQAYIDPGTGSFVVQGIIAAVVGASVAIKLYWKRIKAALTGKKLDDDDDE